MGEVLHIQRARVWLTPGYPVVVVPGIALTLMVDRCGDEGLYHLRIVPDILRQARVPVSVQDFWLVARAVRLDPGGFPNRALVEMAYTPTPTVH